MSNPTKPVITLSTNLSGYKFNSVSVVGNIAYVASEAYGLMLMDLSDTAKIMSYAGDSALSVSIVGNIAYVGTSYNRLQVIDISNPKSPKIIKSIATDRCEYVTVIGNMAYTANGYSGFHIIDIGDLPTLSVADTPGWAYNVKVIGSIAYVADYHGGLQVIDVNNPAKPVIIGRSDKLSSTWDIAIKENTAYVTDYNSGLRVIDISNPVNPIIMGSVDIPGKSFGVIVNNDIAYVANDSSGLQVVDVKNHSKPFIISSVDTPDSAREIAVIGNTAYIADTSSGLQIIDVSNPSKPFIIGSVDTPGQALAVAVAKNIAYVADYTSGLQVIDVSNPSKPNIIGSVDTPGSAFDITIIGNTAYIADSSSGLQMIDISNPTKPIIIGSVDTPSLAYGVAINGNMAYLADYTSGLSIMPLPVEIKSVAVNSPESITLTLPSPQISGNYTLRVFNESENYELTGAVTYMDSPDFQKLRGKKAIIVAGGGPYATNELWQATMKSTNYAYLSLQSQGYTRENIYYLSSEKNIDVDGDGYFNDIDADATYEYLWYAINVWAKDASELILFMVDHGGYGTFQINGMKNPLQIVSADELDRWLDNLQMTMPGRLIVVYDACQSGSFLSMTPPAGKERIVITSSSADEKAWHLEKGVLSFSYQFWASVFLNANLYNSFLDAKNMMQKNQTAWIDANGNGIGNEKEDQRLVNDIIIGRGRVAASAPPFIGTVSGEQTLDGRRDASFEAKNISSLNKIKRVWAVIVPPDYDLASPNQPVTELPVVEMTDDDKDGVYQGRYDNFTQTGTYKLNIYTADDQNSYSVPQQTAVTQTKGNTCVSVSTDLGLNICADYRGTKYGLTLRLTDAAQLSWKADLGTFRELKSDSGNCISVNDDLKLNMCAEYQGHDYGFTMNYDKDLIWKMNVGTFREVQ